MEDLESVSATIDQYCIFFLLLAAFCSITMFLQVLPNHVPTFNSTLKNENITDLHASNSRGKINNAPQSFPFWIIPETGNGVVRRIRKQRWIALRHFSWRNSKRPICKSPWNDNPKKLSWIWLKASGICIGTILNSAGTFLLCIAVAFYYHWKLALVCFTIPVLSLVVVVCEQFISQKNQTLLQESVEKSAKVTS